jgi:hypothetical protein
MAHCRDNSGDLVQGVGLLSVITMGDRMRVPDDVQKSVCFICARNPQRGLYVPGGTGFLVAWTGSGHPQIYLVTARHVVKGAQEEAVIWETGEHVSGDGSVYAGFNLKAAGLRYLKTNGKNWIYPNDPSVDLAVLPLDPPPEADIVVIPNHYMLTPERSAHHSVGIGDELWLPGLFKPSPGDERHRPVIRTATIAAMPDEPIRTVGAQGEQLPTFSAYLIEVRSIGGLSGSPVWLHLPYGRGHDDENPPPSDVTRRQQEAFSYARSEEYNIPNYLLGIVRMHWREVTDQAQTGSPFADQLYRNETPTVVNMGIGAVTPVQDLISLLEREDLIAARQERMRNTIRQIGIEKAKPT